MSITGRIKISLITATALIGLVGSAAAAGIFATTDDGLRIMADAQEVAETRLEQDPIRGDFWAPSGSDAERPEVILETRSWNPHQAEAQQD